MNFTALKFEQHTIIKAYAVLFGEFPTGPSLFLDRKALKSQWEARARQLNAPSTGWSQAVKREDTLDIEELEWAYRSLIELLGSREQALVCGWACESIEAVNAVLKKGRELKTAVRRSHKARPAPVRATGATGATATATESRPAAPPAPPARGPVAPPETPTEDLNLRRVPIDAPGPRTKLMFGRFLLARGHITLQQLIDAVRWQRAQRPPVGRIAMSWGILSANQVYEILSHKSPEDRFCDVAVRRGYMTGFQRLAVLGRQREMQKPIGSYFVEHGILSRDEIEGLAAESMSQ